MYIHTAYIRSEVGGSSKFQYYPVGAKKVSNDSEVSNLSDGIFNELIGIGKLSNNRLETSKFFRNHFLNERTLDANRISWDVFVVVVSWVVSDATVLTVPCLEMLVMVLGRLRSKASTVIKILDFNKSFDKDMRTFYYIIFKVSF